MLSVKSVSERAVFVKFVSVILGDVHCTKAVLLTFHLQYNQK